MTTAQQHHERERFELQFIRPLETACRAAMRQVKAEGPGLYGGRYVVRVGGEPFFLVLGHDDPELIKNEAVVAHVTADKVYAIGHTRYYLDENGNVSRSYFDR